MSSEDADKQTGDPADGPSQPPSIPRWAVIATALLVLLPFLIMLSMMLIMRWYGPPMHGGMATSGLGLIPVLGVIPLLLVLGVIYGM